MTFTIHVIIAPSFDASLQRVRATAFTLLFATRRREVLVAERDECTGREMKGFDVGVP